MKFFYCLLLVFGVAIVHCHDIAPGTSGDTPPTVHQVLLLEPVPIANIVGRDVLRLECNASGNPAPSIEWSFNGIKFQLPEEGGGAEGEEKPVVDNRIKIEGNRLTIFKVKGKTRHDPSYYNSGRYRCIASNTIGSVFSEKNIQIRVMGQFTSGHRQTDEKKIWHPTVGRSYEIDCPPHSFGHGTEYRWGVVPILSGQPEYWLPGEKNKKMFYTSHGTLVWSFISFYDMKESRDIGGLRCIMINFGHFVASNQQVLWRPYNGNNAILSHCDVVKEVRKPIFEAKLSPTMIAPIDSEFVLSCGALGIPAPTYRWQYNGRDIVSRHNNSNELNFEHFQFSGHKMQLRIRRITRYSGGKFTCFARSAIGEVWSHGKLSVSFPPRWIDKFPESIDVVVGNPFELVCNVTGFPQPIIEWYQNSTRIFTRDERKIVTGDKEGDIGGKLTLTSARYQDGGIYICLARNYLDTLTMSVYVKIQDKNVIV